jgi:hypothetical protein
VVVNHGRPEQVIRMEAVCFNSLLGSLFRQCASDHEPRSSRRLAPRERRRYEG